MIRCNFDYPTRSAPSNLREFGPHPEFVAVVRRLEAKLRKPAHGRVSARASGDPDEMAKLFTTLAARGRAIIGVNVEVVDEEGTLALSAVVEWFVAKRETSAIRGS